MNFVGLLLICGISLLVAYFTYGKYVERKLGIDDQRPTPANTMYDGVDYVPAKKPILLGHHFASIAGGGPVVGPIAAALFGWLPVVLWIVLGSIFIGGVHDYAALQASIRHKAQSIGAIIKAYIGVSGQKLFLCFALIMVTLVVGVFVLLVAETFEAVPQAASASLAFLIIAFVFGVLINIVRISFMVASMIGLVAMAGGVWLGLQYPLSLSAEVWVFVLIGYAYLASVLPVWVLLQPRDFLNSYLLYGLMIVAFLGILLASPEIRLPAFTGFYHEKLGYLFPILFVTVACGAMSGFHSIVSSGTTAKQLDRESHGRLVTYGGMLIEAFLALITIGTIAYLTEAQLMARLEETGGPIGTFAAGIGYFMSYLGVPLLAASTFASLVVTAFLLTTMDSATRLGRFLLQELTSTRFPRLSSSKHLCTAFVALGALTMALSGRWEEIWPVLIAVTQMAGAIALLAVTVWLMESKVRVYFTALPMVFMFSVTFAALLVLIINYTIAQNWFLWSLCVLLVGMCLYMLWISYQAVYKKK